MPVQYDGFDRSFTHHLGHNTSITHPSIRHTKSTFKQSTMPSHTNNQSLFYTYKTAGEASSKGESQRGKKDDETAAMQEELEAMLLAADDLGQEMDEDQDKMLEYWISER